MRSTSFGRFGLGLILAGVLSGLATPGQTSTLIVGARLVDGSGQPSRSASIRIDGDRITAVGKLRPRPEDVVIHAEGLTLAPGFIDAHSHHDRGDFADRDMAPLLAEGVTTIVIGQDGESSAPLAKVAADYEARPASLNLASYTGHGMIRDQVMGKDYDRAASEAEVKAMADLLKADMASGSLGLSTGLEYDPGLYSTRDEVLALARVSAAAGGRYISHMRNEDVAVEAALDELLEIGRQTGMPVQISHLKLAAASGWGRAPRILAKLDQARAEGIKVTADVYPYDYWQSNLSVLLPDRDFTDLKAARFALSELATPEGMLIATFVPEPAMAGKTLAEIATARGEPPEVTYLSLVRQVEAWREAHPGASRLDSMIVRAMSPGDVADFIAWPFAVICSDGYLGSRHPRGIGAFAKVLRLYVREQHRFSLESAIHKMTGLTAENLGIARRGLVKPGYYADLVLFDPDRITDHATPEAPQATAEGVSRVWINGALVFEQNRATGSHPGRFIRRGDL